MKKGLLIILVFGFCMFSSGISDGAEPIKIGAIFSLTGPGAHIGVAQRNSVLIAIDEFNKKGGVGGRPVEMVVGDDESDPTKAVMVLKKMVETQPIVALIGPTRTDTGMAMIPTLEKEGIPTFMHAGGDVIITPVRKWIFKSPYRAADAMERIALHLKKHNLNKVGFLHASDGFGKDGAAIVDRLAAKHGFELVAKETFDMKDVDMTAQLTRINARGPQAIIIWTIGPPMGITTKNARALGIKVPLFQCHGAAEPIFFRLAGDAAEGVMMPSTKIVVADKLPDSDVQKKKLVDYIKEYEARFKDTPGTMVAYGADAAYLLLEAIKKAGPDRAKIRDGLEGMKGYVGLSGVYNLSSEDHTGTTVKDIALVKAEKGRFTLVE
ncbi:MAG: ABC transporter substrate-binding protein [Syntrophaceae bacterium]|nr:ABC transporter substrate-binding protein [Syntrophaceae bacterium]